ncbi:hypothetical protein AB4205_09660 [Vibrio sp. 10N.286.49.F3]|uniref:hypothetical protein n=1 Tax=unclassified Vibrio TaxID=2614977 RepID=UPI003552BA00
MCTIIVVGFITRRVPAIAANIGIAFFMVSYALSMFVFKFDIHFLHLTGILFVVTAILMLIIGSIYPSASDYQPKVANVVELEHWKMAKPMAAVICIGVVMLYIIFSLWALPNNTLVTLVTLGVSNTQDKQKQ